MPKYIFRLNSIPFSNTLHLFTHFSTNPQVITHNENARKLLFTHLYAIPFIEQWIGCLFPLKRVTRNVRKKRMNRRNMERKNSRGWYCVASANHKRNKHEKNGTEHSANCNEVGTFRSTLMYCMYYKTRGVRISLPLFLRCLFASNKFGRRRLLMWTIFIRRSLCPLAFLEYSKISH